jgi:hypothetical protein
VPLQRSAVRAGLFLEGEGEDDGEGEEEFSVTRDPLLPSLKRWSGTDGRTPLQIHKRKHQPVSRTPATSKEGARIPLAETFLLWFQKCNHLPPPQAASRYTLAVPPLTVRILCKTAVVQSSWALRVHADLDRTKPCGAGKRSDGIREAGAGHAELQRD